MKPFDVIVLGGGASGLMCALHAARRGLNVVVLEKARKVGIKILVSGGGRCNFTNTGADPRKHYLSENPHFCISAMRRYSPDAFIAMVNAHGIAYHEKKLGQLFCDHSARQIVAMLVDECTQAGAQIVVNAEVTDIDQEPHDGLFSVASTAGPYQGKKVVIATGGLSMPKVATDIGYRIARNYGADIVTPRPALVPLHFNESDKSTYEQLSGIALNARVSCDKIQFDEDILFTHRGLSGPGILQISSYWRESRPITVDLLPTIPVQTWLESQRTVSGRQRLATLLKQHLPNRLVDTFSRDGLPDVSLANLSTAQLNDTAQRLNAWTISPVATEGYRTAEVTLGGINTDALSSKTMEFKTRPGLYAIGEAVDVTGWLGGYNFQWAWASGYACAQAL